MSLVLEAFIHRFAVPGVRRVHRIFNKSCQHRTQECERKGGLVGWTIRPNGFVVPSQCGASPYWRRFPVRPRDGVGPTIQELSAPYGLYQLSPQLSRRHSVGHLEGLLLRGLFIVYLVFYDWKGDFYPHPPPPRVKVSVSKRKWTFCRCEKGRNLFPSWRETSSCIATSSRMGDRPIGAGITPRAPTGRSSHDSWSPRFTWLSFCTRGLGGPSHGVSSNGSPKSLKRITKGWWRPGDTSVCFR